MVFQNQGGKMQIGIDKKERRFVAEGLNLVLSDTIFLAIKCLGYHWNVTGRLFKPLHELFEEDYNILLKAADDVAERIRALGFLAPGSFKEFSAFSVIREEASNPEAVDMIEILILDHETLIRRCKEVLDIASSIGDDGTVDILTQRILTHGKMAWMLRSHIEG